MPFKYQSGEKVKAGDRVLLHGEPGEVALVADPDDPLSDPHDWWIESAGDGGGGVLIAEPKVFGHVFLQEKNSDWQALVLVARRKPEGEQD